MCRYPGHKELTTIVPSWQQSCEGVITPNQIPLTTIVTYLQKTLQKQNFKPLGHFRCLYTKSNPIDDHSNISSQMLSEAEFQTIGPLYLHAMWYLPFTNSPRKHTVTYHFSDLQEVYSGNQIHTKHQLQYFHPPQISTSGKCHCVIIHQTTKATEYIG